MASKREGEKEERQEVGDDPIEGRGNREDRGRGKRINQGEGGGHIRETE